MRFDLFFEVAVPSWLRLSDTRAYAERLNQIESGDGPGYGGDWLVDQRFLGGCSHACRPEKPRAAAASRRQPGKACQARTGPSCAAPSPAADSLR